MVTMSDSAMPSAPWPDPRPTSSRPASQRGASDPRTESGETDATDIAGFVAIYERSYRRIASHVYRRLADRDETEEITAEVFLRAFRSRSQYRGDVPVESWLLGIATYTVCRLLRRRALERRARRLLAPLFPAHEHPDHTFDESDELRHTRIAIDVLPVAQQAIVSLHCLDGVPLKDAAAILGIAEGTAKSRLSRARAKLRRALGRDEGRGEGGGGGER